MGFIRITAENIDAEHICCAMSNKQSDRKKVGSGNALTRGWSFTEAKNAESASSSTSPPKMLGIRWTRTVICTSTACGYPARSRVTDTQTIF